MSIPKAPNANGEPRYLSVKRMITRRIFTGEWPPHYKIPSENELVMEFQVSRMTVNRALRELAMEGVVVRMQGIGSFVAEPKLTSTVLEVQNIADEILARGSVHSMQLVLLKTEAATAAIATALGLPKASQVFHSIVVHYENGVPLQVENRFVNPEMVPEYGAQDFITITPSRYLNIVVPWTKAEHQVEAVLPTGSEAKWLRIGAADPCLQIRRRTFAGSKVVTFVRLVFPGSRYRIESRQVLGGAK